MLTRYFSDEKGATAVEFGMISLLFLTFLFGIIELGRIFWTMNTLQYAIEQTARYALVNSGVSNGTLVTYAADSMSGISVDPADLAVTTTNTTIGGISFIEVDGTYTFTTILPFMPDSMNSLSLTAQARLPYVL